MRFTGVEWLKVSMSALLTACKLRFGLAAAIFNVDTLFDFLVRSCDLMPEPSVIPVMNKWGIHTGMRCSRHLTLCMWRPWSYGDRCDPIKDRLSCAWRCAVTRMYDG